MEQQPSQSDGLRKSIQPYSVRSVRSWPTTGYARSTLKTTTERARVSAAGANEPATRWRWGPKGKNATRARLKAVARVGHSPACASTHRESAQTRQRCGHQAWWQAAEVGQCQEAVHTQRGQGPQTRGQGVRVAE